MGTEAGIGLGSNIGDRKAYIENAIAKLKALSGVTCLAVSSLYETEPVGVPEEFADQTYLNAVAIFDVELDVEDWSASVHAIEDELLRVRTHVRNIPRTIDLDLLYFGSEVKDRPHLHLPHPQCIQRRFVCAPLAECRPDLILPGQTQPISAILAELPNSPTVTPIRNA